MIDTMLNSAMFTVENHENDNSWLNRIDCDPSIDASIVGVSIGWKVPWGNIEDVAMMFENQKTFERFWFHVPMCIYVMGLRNRGIDIDSVIKQMGEDVYKYYEKYERVSE